MKSRTGRAIEERLDRAVRELLVGGLVGTNFLPPRRRVLAVRVAARVVVVVSRRGAERQRHQPGYRRVFGFATRLGKYVIMNTKLIVQCLD